MALVIPSYGRPEQLQRALDSAQSQQRRFDEVLVVVRERDAATIAMLRERDETVVTVSEAGVLAAMRAGAAATASDVIAFTDDDAVLPPTWSQQVLSAFEIDSDTEPIGGVGGRDVLYDGDQPRPTSLTSRVGVVTWWGRVIGNHHRGRGPARDVAVLKGVNAAYRRDALGLPTSLRGDGAQAHYELSVGSFARSRGWRLRYDPAIEVRHYPAARLGDDQRLAPSPRAVADSAFNVMRALAPAQQSRRWLYVHLVGDRACPGVARWSLALLARDHATRARRAPAWRATTQAWRLRHSLEQFTTLH